MKVAEAFVEVRTDTTKAKAEVKSQATSLGGEFAKYFGAAAFGAAIGKSIQSASDLNETVSKSKVIFGAAAAEVEKMGDKAAKSMGMSKRAYLDAAAGLKGLLDNMGLASAESTKWSQDLTGLGADLASFFNTDPADAVAAISSALRGETEPIRAYNVQISDAAVKTKAFEMGLYSGKGAIDGNAKAQATLALIMQQTSSAQGDFARTADGVANSQRVAKAEAENSAASLGQSFLPVYERVVQVVGFLAEKFGELPAPLQVATVALVGIVALAGPLGSMKQTISSVVEAFKNMGTAGRATAGALGAIGVILTVAAIAYAQYADDKAKAAQTTKDFVDALKAETNGQRDATKAAIANKLATKEIAGLIDDFGVSVQDVADFVAGKSVPALDQLTSQYGKLGNLAAYAGNDIGASGRGFEITSRSAAALSAEVLTLRDSYSDAQAQLALTDAVTEQLGIHTDDAVISVAHLATVSDRASTATQVARDSMSEAASAADDLKAAIDAVFSPAMDFEEASRKLAAGVDELTAQFTAVDDKGHKLSNTLDLNTVRGRENRAAVQDQVKSILDFGVAMVEAGYSTADAGAEVAKHTEQLRTQLEMLGLNKDEVDAYLASLGLTPENVTTTLELADADATKRKLEDMLGQLGDIDAGAKAEIQADIDQGRFDEARTKIDALAKDRGVVLKVSVTGGGTIDVRPGGGNSLTVRAYKDGGLVDVPTFLAGEAGREAVLPLTNRSRMVELLGDPRIRGPVADAMGGGGIAVGGSTTIHAPITVYGAERSYLIDIERKLRDLRGGG